MFPNLLNIVELNNRHSLSIRVVMSPLQPIVAFLLRQAFTGTGDALINRMNSEFSRIGPALPAALARAADRAWLALGLALERAGEASKIDAPVATLEKVREFVKNYGSANDDRRIEAIRGAALVEWAAARAAAGGSLDELPLTELAREAAAFERALSADELYIGAHFVRFCTSDHQIASSLPSLALVIEIQGRHRRRVPLLVVAVAYFLRQEMQEVSAFAGSPLSRGLPEISFQSSDGSVILTPSDEPIQCDLPLGLDVLDVDTDLWSDDFDLDEAIVEDDSCDEVCESVQLGNEAQHVEEEVVCVPRKRYQGSNEGVAEAIAKHAEVFAKAVGAHSRASRKRLNIVRRHATVRFFNRMHPETVYPLLVMVTREMVEKVSHPGAEQRASGPVKIDLNMPVEIEPILPGCVCYPSRITSRLGDVDRTFTFHVVPHVLGAVSGARVVLRQGHSEVTHVELDIRVVKQIWVTVSGFLTLALPFAASLLQHFGVDFDNTPGGGFSVYMTATRFLLQEVPVPMLTGALAVVTGGLYWLTRSRRRDQFWDISTIGPDQKLAKIKSLIRDDPERAGEEMAELLAAYPDHQSAWLCDATWCFQMKKYDEALKSYRQAFALGVTKSTHYVRASLAASYLGHVHNALQILCEAQASLPEGEVTGLLCYNLGCYHALVGNVGDAVAALQRAVRKGYTKRASFVNDPDLELLRGHPDFEALLHSLPPEP